MTDDRNHADPDLSSEEAQDRDSRIGAKMHLFLERTIKTMYEEKGIDEEGAFDLMLCSAVQVYAELFQNNRRDIGVFCRSIAEEAMSRAAEGEILP